MTDRDRVLRSAQDHAEAMMQPLIGLKIRNVPLNQIDAKIAELEAPTLGCAHRIIDLVRRGRLYIAAAYSDGMWIEGLAYDVKTALERVTHHALERAEARAGASLQVPIVVYHWGQDVMWCVADARVDLACEEAWGWVYDRTTLYTKSDGTADEVVCQDIDPFIADLIRKGEW